MGKVETRRTAYILVSCCFTVMLAACSTDGGTVATPEQVQPGPAEESSGPGPAPEYGPHTQFAFPVKMRPQAVIEPGFKTASLVQPALLELDFPAPRHVSDTGEIITVAAADYSQVLPSRSVYVKGEYVVFAPDWAAQPPRSIDEAAFCAYKFDITGYTGTPTLSIIWSEQARPLAPGEYWCGIANYSSNTWDFYAGPLDHVLTLDSLEPYTSPEGHLVVIPIITWADRIMVLEELKLGVSETRGTGLADGEPGFFTSNPLFKVGPLPPAVDLAAECAPVADQGNWGACTAFAVANGAFNQELNRVYGSVGWDLEDTQYQVSTKFIYLESNKKQWKTLDYRKGSSNELIALDLIDIGVASEINAPWNLVLDDNWSTAALEDAAVLKAEDTFFLPRCNSQAGINSIKHILAHHGQVAYIRTYLDRDFMNYTGDAVWNYTPPIYGCHAMAIVGYDDFRGAFKVRNSWGTDWGDAGHIWIGYDSFLNVQADIRAGLILCSYSPAVADRFLESTHDFPPPVSVRASRGGYVNKVVVKWEELTEPLFYIVSRDTLDNEVAVTNSLRWDDENVADYLSHSYWVKAVYPNAVTLVSTPAIGFRKQSAARILTVDPYLCAAGHPVTFKPLIEGTGPIQYYWDFGDAGTPRYAYQAAPTVMIGAPGDYEISLEINDSLGSDSHSMILQVVNDQPPECEFSFAPQPVWHGTEMEFDATACSDRDGWIVLYEWDWNGDGVFDEFTDEAIVKHTYHWGGICQVALRVTDSTGLTASTVNEVWILADNNPPMVDFHFQPNTGGLTGFQPPADISIISDTFDYEDDIALYEWDFDGDGVFEIRGEHKHTIRRTFTEHETLSITLRVHDEKGYYGTLTKELWIGFGETIPGWQVHGVVCRHLRETDPLIDAEIKDGRTAVLLIDDYRHLWLAETEGTPANHDDWNVSILLSEEQPVAGKPGMALDAVGRPVLGYYTQLPESGLRFGIRETDSDWSYSDIILPSPGWISETDTIEVIDGKPVIVFMFGNTGDQDKDGLYYAWTIFDAPTSPSKWIITQINENIMARKSVDVEPVGGLPALIYTSSVNSEYQLSYACCDSLTPGGPDNWTTHVVNADIPNDYTSSLAELGGRPVIASLVDSDPDELMFAKATAAQPDSADDWDLTFLAIVSGYPMDCDLTIVDGIPWIVAITRLDYKDQVVTLAHANGPAPTSAADWTVQEFCRGDFTCCDILDAGGKPALFLYKRAGLWLYYFTPED